MTTCKYYKHGDLEIQQDHSHVPDKLGTRQQFTIYKVTKSHHYQVSMVELFLQEHPIHSDASVGHHSLDPICE